MRGETFSPDTRRILTYGSDFIALPGGSRGEASASGSAPRRRRKADRSLIARASCHGPGMTSRPHRRRSTMGARNCSAGNRYRGSSGASRRSTIAERLLRTLIVWALAASLLYWPMSADARPLARGPRDGQVRIYNPTGWQNTMRAAADAWNRTGVTPTIVFTGPPAVPTWSSRPPAVSSTSAATRTTAATGTPNAMGAGGASPCATPTATLTGTLPPQGCGSPRTNSATSSACRITPTTAR